MSYLAIYRRFRPDKFDDVVGQEHVVTTLVNQIRSDRVGHAYLFCGARGTGKTTAAKIFARAINCLSPVNGSPCGECEVCKKLQNPSNLDILEIDAASNNKVENVREIRDSVQYPPVAGKYKVYIIDEVHMLTTEAFNALLKTLEEPPKHAVFILATTEPHKLPATILSRCMRFDFHLVSDKVIQNLIEKIYDTEGKKYEKEATALIARSGEGSVRDALSLADLCLSYNDEKLTYKTVIELLGASDRRKTVDLIGAILKGDTGDVLAFTDELTSLGKSVGVLVKDVCNMLRDVLVVKTCKAANSILMLPEDEFELLKNLSEIADKHRLLRVMEIFASVENDLKYSTHPRVVFETAAIKASMPSEDYNTDALVARIARLEKELAEIQKSGVGIRNVVVTQVPEQKSAYKPVNEQKVGKSDIVETTKSEEAAPLSAPESFIEEIKPEPEKRLAGFDYATDDAPDEEEYVPPVEDQIGFDVDGFFATPVTETTQYRNQGVEMSGGSGNASAPKQKVERIAPEEVEVKTRPEQKAKVNENKISDSRIWGMVIRKLRETKNIMLWIACQELEAKVDGEVVTVFADGENEYNLLTKPESNAILTEIVREFAPYSVAVKKSGETVANEKADTFDDDVKKVNELFDGKITVKD